MVAAPRLQRGQPYLGIADKLPHAGFGLRVFRKSEDSPHPHDALPKPSLFVFKIEGHKTSVPHDHASRGSRASSRRTCVACGGWCNPRGNVMGLWLLSFTEREAR
jgi:hypothetical protein